MSAGGGFDGDAGLDDDDTDEGGEEGGGGHLAALVLTNWGLPASRGVGAGTFCILGECSGLRVVE
jgi:hypothetical protein